MLGTVHFFLLPNHFPNDGIVQPEEFYVLEELMEKRRMASHVQWYLRLWLCVRGFERVYVFFLRESQVVVKVHGI